MAKQAEEKPIRGIADARPPSEADDGDSPYSAPNPTPVAPNPQPEEAYSITLTKTADGFYATVQYTGTGQAPFQGTKSYENVDAFETLTDAALDIDPDGNTPDRWSK